MRKRLTTATRTRPRKPHANERSTRAANKRVPPAANPYGGGPGTGITLPPYYRPTEYMKNNNNYFPGTEPIGEDEMRISFLGSTPFPPTRDQAGTCIMVELGNGRCFFFDFGPGCMRNVLAMQVPIQTVNDIFFTHLHVDHYADLPYLYVFAPWMARWKPLRVHGPSGRTPRDGIRHMIEHMKEMAYWHTDSFNSFPIGDGYEVEVNEFDFRDDNGICYEKDGVVVRHWRRSHTKDGASAYRLDWNGLSFVWTGDGRPDELTAKYAKGVDVFVSEIQPDLGNLTALKFGTPPIMFNVTIDGSHSPAYAVGYLFKQIQPRLAMVTHMSYDENILPEMVAGIRTHYKGLFQFGAPDVVVVNVTKDAIWARKAALPEAANPARLSPPDAIELFDLALGNTKIRFPKARHTVAEVQEAFVRDQEIDPRKYYPQDVYRKPNRVFPQGLTIDVKEMMLKKLKTKLESKLDKLSVAQGRRKGIQALRVVQTLGQELEAAKSPEGLVEIVQQLGGLLEDTEILGEMLENLQALGEVLNRLQGLVKLLKDAQGKGTMLRQMEALRKAS